MAATPGIPAADFGVAATVAVLGVVGTAIEFVGAGRTEPLAMLGGCLIAVAAAAILVWQRRAPMAVACGVIVLCLAYHLLGYPGFAPAVAMFAAVYAMVAYSTGHRLLPTAIGIVAISVIPVLPPNPASFNVGALFGPPTGMIAAAAVAEAARTRRIAAAEQLRSVRQTAAEEARRRLVEERLDIARELHDVLAHTITVIAVQAAVGADALDDRPDETRAALAAVRSAARDAMAELRSTLVLLRAGGTVRPQPGLAQLPRLVEQATAAGVTVRLDTSGDPQGLTAVLELAVYRIVQEALTNTIRHSTANSATVVITYGPDEVAVEVTDEGPAASEPSDDHNAHGLTGMRERARALGGTLEAGSGPGKGFTVAARLPVRGTT